MGIAFPPCRGPECGSHGATWAAGLPEACEARAWACNPQALETAGPAWVCSAACFVVYLGGPLPGAWGPDPFLPMGTAASASEMLFYPRRVLCLHPRRGWEGRGHLHLCPDGFVTGALGGGAHGRGDERSGCWVLRVLSQRV